MHRQLKVAHAADLHLGSPFARLPEHVSTRLKDEQRAYLTRLVDRCLAEEVDLLLLAGDVFDRPDVNNIWINRLAEALAKLDPIDVYIVPGNHDPYYPDSVWDRGQWSSNVHIFKEANTLHHERLGLDISAFPFTGLREHAPLDDAHLTLSEDPADFRLLLLHAELIAGQQSQSAYNPISRNHPSFQHFDYVALGHIHQTDSIHLNNDRRTVIRYSGCPQGRGFDELGEKGFWIERLSRGLDASGRYVTTHESDFYTLDSCQFLIEAIDISNCEDERAVSSFLLDELNRLMQQYGEAVLKKACLRLVFTGRVDPAIELDLASLQELAMTIGLSYVELRDKTETAWPLERYRNEHGFFAVLIQNYDDACTTILRSRFSEEEKAKRIRLLDAALNYALDAGEADR